jgi:hypothetical protein
VDGIGSGLCPVSRFGFSGVEPTGSGSTVFCLCLTNVP